jgi:hypothetical protein
MIGIEPPACDPEALRLAAQLASITVFLLTLKQSLGDDEE